MVGDKKPTGSIARVPRSEFLHNATFFPEIEKKYPIIAQFAIFNLVVTTPEKLKRAFCNAYRKTLQLFPCHLKVMGTPNQNIHDIVFIVQ